MDATTEAENDWRWAEAEALLSDPHDQSRARGIRQRRRKILLIGFGTWLALVALGGVIGWFMARENSPTPDDVDASQPQSWVQIIGLTCSAVGFLIIVLSLVRLVRSGQWSGRWRAPTSVLTRSQKRELYRQMSGKSPVQPDRLALVRDSAQRVTQLRRQLGTLSGGFLLLLGAALNSSNRFAFGFTAVIIVVSGVAFLLVRRDIRRATRFLEQHPTPAAP